MADHGTRAQYMREWRMIGPICRHCMIAASLANRSPIDVPASKMSRRARDRALADLRVAHLDEYRAAYRHHYMAAMKESR